MGLANNLPNIPGLRLVNSIPGLEGLPRLSKYNSNFLSVVFTIIMIVVVLKSSFAQKWQDRGQAQFLGGLALDMMMLVTTIVLSTVYLIEHERSA